MNFGDPRLPERFWNKCIPEAGRLSREEENRHQERSTMSEQTTQQSAPKQQRQSAERTPIRIERLLITHGTASGVLLPSGMNGESTKQEHMVVAGDHGAVHVEIEHRPWMRVFRVARYRRITRGGKDLWELMGKPFHIPDAWCVSVPADE